MFSTDFIFRQQENLVNIRLDSGHYATKYHYLLENVLSKNLEEKDGQRSVWQSVSA